MSNRSRIIRTAHFVMDDLRTTTVCGGCLGNTRKRRLDVSLKNWLSILVKLQTETELFIAFTFRLKQSHYAEFVVSNGEGVLEITTTISAQQFIVVKQLWTAKDRNKMI